MAGFKYAHYPKSQMKDVSGNQETSFNEYGFFINVPTILKKDNTIMVNGLGYGQVQASMYNYPTINTDVLRKKLEVVYYQFSLIHKWNDKWMLAISLKPTLSSDFEDKLSVDDFVFQGGAFITRKFNDKLKIGAGVVNSTRWGSPIVVPTINIHYKHNRHTINAILPISAKYTYSFLPSKKLNLGLGYGRNGADFNVYDSNFPELDKINYSRANVGMIGNYQLTKILRFEISGGISTGRTYRLVDQNQNLHNFDSKAAPYLNLGIVLVPPKKD
nr:DUF6268 family outer membrane beta-barrel protein [Lentimicrobium sp. S6]